MQQGLPASLAGNPSHRGDIMTATPEVYVRQLTKSYGPVRVLDRVDLAIAPGEIHAILGENGAGKSTLLKILGGAITADSGELMLDDRVVEIATPRDAIDHGIILISQELALVPHRSVLENVMLGRWAQRGGFVDTRADLEQFRVLNERTGFELDPDTRVGDLPIGRQQQVEILKALARGARVLCMDEPTAVLNEAEKEQLLRVVREIAAAGTTIVIVSHFLDEVLSLAHRVTVLRDGKLIETGPVEKYTPESLVTLMVGREVDPLNDDPSPVDPAAEVVLSLEGFGTAVVRDVDLEVRRGEIVGIAGLVGSGRSDLLLGVFGADRRRSGTVRVRGEQLPANSIRAAIDIGVALVPESRKDQGLVLGRSVLENVALVTLARRAVLGWVQRRRERAVVDEVARDVDLRGYRAGTSMSDLSGGNQQKALFAKWLIDPPVLLMVDEPTRGIDIAAKARIHGLLRGLAERGTAVLVVSSELDEVIRLSHRVLVMRHGRIVDEFDRSARPDDIITSAFTK
jgi:ABC-type sugar transport system ATPase subunit